MIVSKTPFRMSFVGGGSDLASFYRKEGRGAVLSTTIDKYMYVAVNRKFEKGIRISYSVTEELSNIEQIKHPIVRNVLEYLDIQDNIEITSIADIPSNGSGLGSSSSFTVALIHAVYAYNKNYISKGDLGKLASHVEINLCKDPIGKQDQYAAAFGGLNLIEFNEDETVSVEPIICKEQTMKKMEESIIVFYTGRTHNAASLLKEQSDNLNSNSKRLLMREMVSGVYEMKKLLESGDFEYIGDLLDKNWKLKCQMSSNITNSKIDDWYKSGIAAGASGGKLLGAGSGGFLMFFAPLEKHCDIINAMKGLRRVPIKFEKNGSQIVFCQ